MERRLTVQYRMDGFYGDWETQSTDVAYVLNVIIDDKIVSEQKLDAPVTCPVRIYETEGIQDNSHIKFELNVISQKAIIEYDITSGADMLIAYGKRIIQYITDDRQLIFNQQLVQNETWVNAWTQLYGTGEIVMTNVQDPIYSLEDGKLYICGDQGKAIFYIDEASEDDNQTVELQFEFTDLSSDINSRFNTGALTLSEIAGCIIPDNTYSLTTILGSFIPSVSGSVTSKLTCRNSVMSEKCFQLTSLEDSKPLPIWKDKLELLDWQVTCRYIEYVREDATIVSYGISILGEFVIGAEKKAALSVVINNSDEWTIYLESREGNWLTALANLVGFSENSIINRIVQIQKDAGDFSIDYVQLSFSVSKNDITDVSFVIRQHKDCNLFGLGIYLCKWDIMVELKKEIEWEYTLNLTGELRIGNGETAPKVCVSIPLEEDLKQIILKSDKDGISIPSIENLLSLIGIGDGSQIIPEQIYNLDDFKLNNMEICIDVTDTPFLQSYQFEIVSEKELSYDIAGFNSRISNIGLKLSGGTKESMLIEGNGKFVFQQIVCNSSIKIDCEKKSVQFSIVLTEEQAQQIGFTSMADDFADTDSAYDNLLLPEGFSSPVFEKAVIWADTGKQKYVISGSLRNIGTCIFETSLDSQEKRGYILAAALDENFLFANISHSLDFVDGIFKIQTGGLVLSTLTGRGIRQIFGELPSEINAPSGLPNMDCEVSSGLFLYGSIKLVAPVFSFIFGTTDGNVPVLETALYFPKDKDEMAIRVGLNDVSFFNFIHLRNMVFMCHIADGTRYMLTGEVYLAMCGSEFGFDFQASGDTKEQKLSLSGTARSPIELGFLKLTDISHTKGPGLALDITSDSKRLGLSGGIVLFGEPFADIKSLGYDFKQDVFYGEVAYTGSVEMFHGNISFTWSQKKGIEIQNFPMKYINDALDYSKLIEQATSASTSECKKLVGMAFDKVIKTEFNITPSFGGMENDMLRVELLPQYTVSVADSKILSASMNKLHIDIEKPSEISFEGLAELVVNVILDNAKSIAKQLVDDVDNMTKLIAAMGAVKLTEDALEALICRGSKEFIENSVNVNNALSAAEKATKTAAGGNGPLAATASTAVSATGSAATASDWLEVLGSYFGVLGGTIIVIAGGGDGDSEKERVKEFQNMIEENEKQLKEAEEEAREAVESLLTIKNITIKQSEKSTAVIEWSLSSDTEDEQIEYHLQIVQNGVESNFTETLCHKEIAIEPGIETQLDIRIYAVYRYDEEHVYQGKTEQYVTVIGKPLKILNKALPDVITGSEYHVELTAEGGCQPYIWNIYGFPKGIEISNQTISGITHYGGGEVYVDITVTDAVGDSATSSFWVEVK